jgi:hypothetical protein
MANKTDETEEAPRGAAMILSEIRDESKDGSPSAPSALEAAQNDVASEFSAATGVPVFRGLPEATAK